MEDPTAVVRNQLDRLEWKYSVLAHVLGRKVGYVEKVMTGRVRLTAKGAGELEVALGVRLPVARERPKPRLEAAIARRARKANRWTTGRLIQGVGE